MLTEFLRSQAAWRLANAERAPVPTARCAAALLDAAAYVATLADDDPDLAALNRSGCFRGKVFDPGPRGLALARWWQFSGTAHARPRDLIAALAAEASGAENRQAGSHRKPEEPAAAAAGQVRHRTRGA